MGVHAGWNWGCAVSSFQVGTAAEAGAMGRSYDWLNRGGEVGHGGGKPRPGRAWSGWFATEL